MAHRADLYILSEAPRGELVEAFRESLGPDYQSALFGGLAVVAAGRIRTEGWLIDRPRTKVQAITWERAGRPVALLVVDLPSEILVHRHHLLREVNELIERHSPDLVVGDFNAPRRSWALSNLPAGYRHAYETAGGACGYTWPAPLPMYSLDHCIHAPTVVPVRYDLHSSIYSDHRRQVFDFALPE